MRRRRGLASPGFTLIELMVVMSIIALLLTIALPRYLGSVDRAREATLRQSLSVMRDAIDKFHADQGRYPNELAELERLRYIRAVPMDPMTDSTASWAIVAPPSTRGLTGKVYDVRSGAAGKALDGSEFASW